MSRSFPRLTCILAAALAIAIVNEVAAQSSRTQRPLDRRFDQRLNPRDQLFSAEPNRGRALSSEAARFPGQQRQSFNFGAEFSAAADPRDGLRVSSIQEGTLAAEIGLQETDALVSIGGRRLSSADEVNHVLLSARTGEQRIPIVVRRDGTPTTLYVQPQVVRDMIVVPRRQIDPALGVAMVPYGNDRLIVQEVRGGLGDIIGLRENDIILTVAGRSVTSQEEFVDLLYSADAADIPIVINRDGRTDVLYVRQDELNFRMYDRDADLYVANNAWLGAVMDVRQQNAAVVERVVPGSPADEAGVRRGDWIVRINGRRVTSPAHLTRLIDMLQPGDEVQLDVSRRVSGTLVAKLAGEAAYESEPRQALRPTYDYYDERPDDVQVDQRQYYRGEITNDGVRGLDRRGLWDRVGPTERGLRDRLDRDQTSDAPLGRGRP